MLFSHILPGITKSPFSNSFLHQKSVCIPCVHPTF